MILTLPWPPATNNLYLNAGKRRIRTPRYEAWLSEALTAVREQRAGRTLGSFHVRILADRPDRRKRDLDGLLKAPIDLLVKAGIVEDDSHMVSLFAAWSDAEPKKPGALTVCVEGV